VQVAFSAAGMPSESVEIVAAARNVLGNRAEFNPPSSTDAVAAALLARDAAFASATVSAPAASTLLIDSDAAASDDNAAEIDAAVETAFASLN
jgi:hypothetical protein